MKHRIPPIDKNRWCAMPHDFLDLEFDNVPIISIENPIANIILIFIHKHKDIIRKLTPCVIVLFCIHYTDVCITVTITY